MLQFFILFFQDDYVLSDFYENKTQYSHVADITLNPFPNKPWFLILCSTSLFKTVGKGEIAGNEQFLHFSQCFLPVWRTFYHFHHL